ncbi:hypothetical protein DN555_23970 [Enterobacter asburiae]|jgi:hypothetical protein|uniref:Uncharacterized protein n=2 Tax=Enterobacterales TaxID=91347 RepID=A0A6N2YPH6_ENTAG|nr:hypothetical protein MC67_00170 [Enterobacter cloacae complex sp.]KUQ54579.1 hypothetical protein AWI17_15230 [Enterobacter asburiae]TXT71141.1 hypothetical protein D4N14_22395 [Enterobacter hormaechei]CZW94284.1 Uncharacterised protein [Enterobacter cloacae]KVJ11156.1 hypothetical protein AWS40_22070 [Enterobacter asburiae]
MEKAIVVNRQVLTSRPQAVLMVHSLNGYTVCVIPAAFSLVVGQELYRPEHHRGVWRVSGSNDLFPANVTGSMTLDEAQRAFNQILSQ